MIPWSQACGCAWSFTVNSDRTAKAWFSRPREFMMKSKIIIHVAIIVALLAGVWFAFSPALSNEFVTLDDNLYVTHNEHVQQGISRESLRWAFNTGYENMGMWHPLTWISHMADCEMFG